MLYLSKNTGDHLLHQRDHKQSKTTKTNAYQRHKNYFNFSLQVEAIFIIIATIILPFRYKSSCKHSRGTISRKIRQNVYDSYLPLTYNEETTQDLREIKELSSLTRELFYFFAREIHFSIENR